MEVKKAPSQIFDLVLNVPLWTELYIQHFLKEHIFRKLLKFFKVLHEEKQNFKNACKKDILQQSSGLQAFIKKRLQRGCFPVNIPSIRNSLFYRTILMAVF